MSHKKKYYKDIESNGHIWRLEIWQDTEEDITLTEIGPVIQGLKLVIQGEQADIDTPIIKTSLEMQFIDAPGFDYERKCGYWEEFYTSSATEYKVLVYKDGVIEWSGYITPDSFAEDLRYRGSVSIIARDNLGTLQDITCDISDLQNIDGKAYIYEILQKGFNASGCAMELISDELVFPYSGYGKYQISGRTTMQMLDVSTLQAMNWWEVLESILYSIGGVIRYTGSNQFTLMPIRDMPKYGKQYWWDVPRRDVQFLAYGRRELIPGIKSIVEVNEFDTVNAQEEKETVSRYGQSMTTRQCVNLLFYNRETGSYNDQSINMPAWAYYDDKTQEYIQAQNSPLLNISAYTRVNGEDSEQYGAWDDPSIIYYMINQYPSSKHAIFRKGIFSPDVDIEVRCTLDKPVSLTTDLKQVLNTPVVHVSEHTEAYAQVIIAHKDSTTLQTRYYNAGNNTWQDGQYLISVELNGNMFLTDKSYAQDLVWKGIRVPSVGELSLIIASVNIPLLRMDVRVPCIGMYSRIKNIQITATTPEETGLSKKITVTTKYSDKYAVRLNREPKFAINPTTTPMVAYLANAILMEDANDHNYIGATDWQWMHGRSMEEHQNTGVLLSQLIHQQVLAFHSKPNNSLTGELSCKDPIFSAIYNWQGKDHYLLSGTYNILTGRIEGAVLREYTRYDHMWETWVPEEDIKIDSETDTMAIKVMTNKALQDYDVTGCPSWLSVSSVDTYGGHTYVSFFVIPNRTDADRVAVIQIDTAYVRIIQTH